MDAKVVWKKGMSFIGVGDSGFEVPIGTSVEQGGADDGVRPMEMVLLALGGCTGMDVVSILAKKRQTVTAFEVRLHGERATEHPKKFEKITLEYVVTGHGLDPVAVNRSIELSETKYCSVMATLRGSVEIATQVTIQEG